VEEAVELRLAKIDAPILILGYTPPDASAEVIRWDLVQTIFQQEQVEAFIQASQTIGRPARVHVKVDTGMGRLGLQAEAAADFIESVSKREQLVLEGVFSHLATADEADKSYAKEQMARWKKLMEQLEQRGVRIPLRHIANSAAAIEFPEAVYDMVRIGIALYGYYPSKDVTRSRVDLRQAISLKSQIVYLKSLPKGAGVSYGATRVERDGAVIATVPVGYADGYSRLVAGKAHVLVHGQRVPVIGRICMDQLMIDVTDVDNVRIGDEVVLYGGQGEAFISVDEVAEWMGTISYEVTCHLGKRVPRKYVFSNRE
jgi:alanine racemase